MHHLRVMADTEGADVVLRVCDITEIQIYCCPL